MAVTLSDAALLSLPMMTRGVIDTVVRESRVLALLPFEQVVGNSYIYNQESAMSSADVGAPIWSATTVSRSRLSASRSIVLAKLPPWAPKTQLVRKIR